MIADHLRSTSFLHRRRRAALERRARLRAAPDHAPRHAPRASARARRAADAPARARAGRRDGAGLSRARPRAGADRGSARARGDAVSARRSTRACGCSTRQPAALGEGDELPGETAFKLYDTYGFPYDLTEDALRARGIGVDRAGFDAAMAQQKAAARAAWKGSGAAADGEDLVRHRRARRRDRIHRLHLDRGRGPGGRAGRRRQGGRPRRSRAGRRSC